MTFRIQLLGRMDVRKDDAPIALPTRKIEALLAVLALRPGVPFERQWLAALLWPNVPEAQGRASLRQALGHLRKQLAPELLATRSDQVHLAPGELWVDTAEVERVLARAPIEREALAALVQGPLLEAFPAIEEPFGDWLAHERVRLAERAAAGLEACLAALSAAAHVERALALGGALLGMDPTREGAHRALMRLHAERGDRAAALRQYERCRDALSRLLGVKPSAETERLREDLMAEEASPAGERLPANTTARPGLAEANGGFDDGRLVLAVIPFVTDSEDADARRVARGLSEDVVIELARFRQLALIANSTIEAIVHRTREPRAIARETGARLVLCGSLRHTEDRIRLTASLVDGTTGLQLWGERWNVTRADPFSAVDRLTHEVVVALALGIDETRLSLSRRGPRERLEVYDCWLRGLECLRRGSESSDDEARSYFEQALALSPGFARAHAGISLAHFNDWSCQAWERWDERERLAFESARRAVELDDSDHVTHFILARIHVYRREFELGERHLEQGLALNSSDAPMLMHASLVRTQLGEPERGVRLAADALRLNPKRPDWYYPVAAFSSFIARRPEEAIRLALRAPDAVVDARALLAAAYAQRGEGERAKEQAARFLDGFRRKIVRDRALEPGEPVRWLLHVNPLQRQSDVEYLLEGLARAAIR